MKYYLSLKDRAIVSFARVFLQGLNAIAGIIGFSAAKAAEFEAAIDDYETALSEQTAARMLLSGKTARKKETQKRLKDLIKNWTKAARANPDVSKPQLVQMGLKVRDGVKTAVGRPAVVPQIDVEIKRRRVHRIRVYDFTDSSVNAKPEDVWGAEIWVFVGETSELNEKNLRYLGLATRRWFETTHDATDVGKTAHYLARWITKRAETSDWSNTASATVAE